MNLSYGTVNPAQKRFPFVYSLFLSYIIILISAFIISYFFHYAIWIQKNYLIHTALELLCTFIAFCIFIVIWYTYDNNPPYLNCLGLGFLAIGLYEILHILYYPNPGISIFSDISTKFWILSNITEAIIILFFITASFKYKIPNRYLALLITLLVGGIPTFLIIKYNRFLPVLLTKDGFTPIKVALEYVAIAINATSLVLLFKKIHLKGIVSYNNVFIALLISVTSGFAFAHMGHFGSFYNGLGHVFKIFNYFYLFNGVFISSIAYPYKKLNENVTLTSDILNQFPNGLIMFNEQDRLLLINDTAKKILHLTDKDILGLDLAEFEQKVGLQNEFTGAEPNFLPMDDNLEKIKSFINKNGDKVILSIKNKSLINGKLVIFSEASAEQEMTSLQLQTRTILDSFSNVAILYNKYGNIIMCNKSFTELTGLDNQVIVGMHINELWDVYLMPHIHNVGDVINKADNSDDINNFKEVAFRTHKGENKILLFHLAPIINYNGEKTAIIAIGSDITQLKEQQEVIVQQEKLAMLGQMGASIVHETKNFLTTIKGGSQLLSLLAEDPQVKKIAQKIDSATDDVNRIISDFLLLSKPKSTMYVDTSMNDIITSIRSMLETSTFMKGAKIKLYISEQEKRVYCDEAQIKQVLFNIAKNGVEAMSDLEEPILDIRSYIDSHKRAMVIEITDKGRGIPNEDIERIGTPFYTTKKNGTGLGLSVCYRIIKEHGGNIKINSKLGSGTTFIISLPYID